MSTKAPEDSVDTEKPKSKKMLIIIVVAVLLLVIIGGGAAFFLLKKGHSEDGAGHDEEDKAPAKIVKKAPDPKAPPTYLPMDSMVVNLADPGGSRFVQLGITLKLDEPKTADVIKQYMPSVRSAVLMEVSRRTADELLAPEGKEKLVRAIIRVVSEQLGYEVDDEDEASSTQKKKKKRSPQLLPVEAVLFSSFIVQ